MYPAVNLVSDFFMPTFSIPADFQASTIEQIGKRNENWDIPIKDVYGSLNPSIFGSGRTSSVLKPIKFDLLKKYVEACNQNGVKFNYALNFNCISNMEFTESGKKEIVKFLRKLGSIGVERFTTVLFPVIELLNYALPDAKVSVSVISNVDSYARLKEFLSTKNVSRIMLPESMNRKLAKLEKLTSYGKKLGCDFGTIVNGACLIDCPFRDFHYSFNSHAVGHSNYQPSDYYATRCTLIKLNNPEEILKMGWIRPEDLKQYINSGISVFKLAGREMTKPDFLRVVDIYNQGSYDGNLWELFRCFSTPPDSSETLNYTKMFNIQNKNLDQFTGRFFESKSFCTTKDCETCNYCKANSHLVQVNDFDAWKQRLDNDHNFIKNSIR
jgi:collagenase-like PrtC family protease